MNVPFYKPYITGNEIKYIQDIIENNYDLAGDGVYTKKVHSWFQSRYGVSKALLTSSGTSALELAIKLLDLHPGDEVISPSFTFSSTVNAILLEHGVTVKFVDVEEQTLNIDLSEVKKAITKKTKAIMVVHYAGISCDMDMLMKIAKDHNLKVIEDAAQAIESKYKGKQLGTIGDFGCMSFHGTKNITCGEGGVLFINTTDPVVHEKAEIIREKGTNRSKFLQGLVDKYTWVDLGGSYLPSDMLSAFLYAQLEQIDTIITMRQERYIHYKKALEPYASKGLIQMPGEGNDQQHNAHIFYVLLPTQEKRNTIMKYLRSHGISAAFHYIPLHSSPFGMHMGNNPDELPVTNSIAGRQLRLPLFSGMKKDEQDYVIKTFIEALENHIS